RRVDDDLEVLAGQLHLPLGALALGDVLAGAAQARRATGGVSLDGGPRLDRAHAPVGTDDTELRLEAVARRDPGARAAQHARAIIGMNQRDEQVAVDRDAAGL